MHVHIHARIATMLTWDFFRTCMFGVEHACSACRTWKNFMSSCCTPTQTHTSDVGCVCVCMCVSAHVQTPVDGGDDVATFDTCEPSWRSRFHCVCNTCCADLLAPTLTREYRGAQTLTSVSPCLSTHFSLNHFTKGSRSTWTDRQFIHSDLPKPRPPHIYARLHTVFGLNELESRNGTSRDSNGRLLVIVSAVLPLQPTHKHQKTLSFLWHTKSLP